MTNKIIFFKFVKCLNKYISKYLRAKSIIKTERERKILKFYIFIQIYSSHIQGVWRSTEKFL